MKTDLSSGGSDDATQKSDLREKKAPHEGEPSLQLAGATRLELATSDVTEVMTRNFSKSGGEIRRVCARP
jgi:hypothetical protein